MLTFTIVMIIAAFGAGVLFGKSINQPKVRVNLEPSRNEDQTELVISDEVAKCPIHIVTPFDHISYDNLTKEEKKEFVDWIKVVNGFLLLEPSTSLEFPIMGNSKVDSRKTLKALLIYYQESGWLAAIKQSKQTGEGEKKKTTYTVEFKPNLKIKSIKYRTLDDEILEKCKREVEELLREESISSNKEETEKGKQR